MIPPINDVERRDGHIEEVPELTHEELDALAVHLDRINITPPTSDDRAHLFLNAGRYIAGARAAAKEYYPGDESNHPTKKETVAGAAVVIGAVAAMTAAVTYSKWRRYNNKK